MPFSGAVGATRLPPFFVHVRTQGSQSFTALKTRLDFDYRASLVMRMGSRLLTYTPGAHPLLFMGLHETSDCSTSELNLFMLQTAGGLSPPNSCKQPCWVFELLIRLPSALFFRLGQY